MIASGGMGQVWKAQTTGDFQKTVALKTILPHLAKDTAFLTMFLDEARLCARLTHPNICQVFELGQVDDTHFMTMEYLSGADLAALQAATFARGHPIPLALCVRIVADAAAGLHYAHSLTQPDGTSFQIVHRDVSPQNIFVTEDGAVKLLDFGIAKAWGRVSNTASGQIKGKFGFMSPEQTRNHPLDRRSDIFSLGTVMYELLTQHPLFRSDSMLSTIERVREAAIEPPSLFNANIPPALDAIVLKALARERDDRWATAGDLQTALEEWLSDTHTNASNAQLARFMKEADVAGVVRAKAEIADAAGAPNAVQTRPDPPGSVAGAAPRRSRLPIIALSVGALFALGSVVAGVWSGPAPQGASRPALESGFSEGPAAPPLCRIRANEAHDIAHALASTEAVEALQTLTDRSPEASTLLARAALDANRPDVARAAAMDAIAHCPEWAVPHIFLARAAQVSQDPEAAKAAFRVAINQAPEWNAPRLDLASVLLAQKPPPLAETIALLDSIIKRNDTFPHAHLLRGQAYLMAHQTRAAAADLERAIEDAPDDPLVKKITSEAAR